MDGYVLQNSSNYFLRSEMIVFNLPRAQMWLGIIHPLTVFVFSNRLCYFWKGPFLPIIYDNFITALLKVVLVFGCVDLLGCLRVSNGRSVALLLAFHPHACRNSVAWVSARKDHCTISYILLIYLKLSMYFQFANEECSFVFQFSYFLVVFIVSKGVANGFSAYLFLIWII